VGAGAGGLMIADALKDKAVTNPDTDTTVEGLLETAD